MTIIRNNQKKIRFPSDQPRRKAIPKKVRSMVHEKYGGRCAYCGEAIALKGMNVDHIKAVHIGGCDSVENLNPSCRACNNFKYSWTIEELRYALTMQVDRARKSSVNFRNAERYGLIQVTDIPVVFYFEQFKTGG